MFDAPLNDGSSIPVQQHPNFAAALRDYGRTPLTLAGNAPIQIFQRHLFGGLKLAMVSRARINQPRQLAQQLKQAGLHRHLIIFSPDHPVPVLAEIGAVPVMTPGYVAEIDLSQDSTSRRANLHQKWRNRLGHAERQSLRITRQNMPIDPSHWLLLAETTHQKQAGYRNWPASLTLAYAQENPSAAKLFCALEGRDVIAAMLFLRHGTGATYHIGHNTARGRALSAHNLLLWQAATWLATKGHKRLDLGLIDTHRSPGLARFKLGAGAKARALGGTWIWWPPFGKHLRPLARLDQSRMLAPF